MKQFISSYGVPYLIIDCSSENRLYKTISDVFGLIVYKAWFLKCGLPALRINENQYSKIGTLSQV